MPTDEREELERLRGQVASVLALAKQTDGLPSHASYAAVSVGQAIRERVSDEGVEAHERRLRAEAWDDALREAYGLGWLHEPGRDDTIARNPYRAEAVGDQLNQEGDG